MSAYKPTMRLPRVNHSQGGGNTEFLTKKSRDVWELGANYFNLLSKKDKGRIEVEAFTSSLMWRAPCIVSWAGTLWSACGCSETGIVKEMLVWVRSGLFFTHSINMMDCCLRMSAKSDHHMVDCATTMPESDLKFTGRDFLNSKEMKLFWWRWRQNFWNHDQVELQGIQSCDDSIFRTHHVLAPSTVRFCSWPFNCLCG